MGENLYVTARANKCRCEHQRSDAIGQRTDERNGKLAEALVGGFLAFRVGIGEQPADGQQTALHATADQISRHH